MIHLSLPRRETSDTVPWAARFLQIAMETLVLLIVCLSPWAFGSVEPKHEFLLLAGVALLLVLWAGRMLVERCVRWAACPFALCLAAMFVVGAWQLAPLPESLLTRVSPATARMYRQLLPPQPEVLPLGRTRDALTPPAGSTISLYPQATRKSLVRLLAVFLLFVAVRNNVASPAALRRMCVAALVTGGLLSAFGLIQFFSSPQPGELYWTYQSEGQPFGPFVNRNHFAFYVNMCIGLSLGLLLTGRLRSTSEPADQGFLAGSRRLDTLRDLLHDPWALWIVGGLALMLSSVVFCLSRGGFLALLGAAILCSVLGIVQGRRGWKAGATLFSFALALALLIWFGWERVEARLATLWSGTAFQGARAYFLSHCWPHLKDFPLWGTGYGTFQYIEPMQFHTPKDVGVSYEHAHNDYLEDLLDGGLARLVLRLAAICVIFRFGYRAFRAHSRRPAGAMALGALFAFTTIVIHSLFEFGLYIPAIVAFATVMCAHLCSLGERADAESRRRHVGDRSRQHRASRTNGGKTSNGRAQDAYRCWGAAPVLGAATAVLLAWLLYAEGSRAAMVERYRQAAGLLHQAAAAGRVEPTREIPYLQTATRLDPHDAELQFALAEAHFDTYREQSSAEGLAAKEAHELKRKWLAPALQHVLQARDLCPLLPTPHARIAVHMGELDNADPRSVYLERTKLLAPADPELWRLCGLQELADKRPEQACRDLRRSLELSDRYLPEILDRDLPLLGLETLVEEVLPDEPHILLAAALHLDQQPEFAPQPRILLDRALALLGNRPEPLSSEDLHTKAGIHKRLGQPTEALAAYQAALAEQPLRVNWRYEFARLLYDQGLRQELRRELETILGQQPNHGGARKLMKRLEQETAEGRIRKTAPSGLPHRDRMR